MGPGLEGNPRVILVILGFLVFQIYAKIPEITRKHFTMMGFLDSVEFVLSQRFLSALLRAE